MASLFDVQVAPGQLLNANSPECRLQESETQVRPVFSMGCYLWLLALDGTCLRLIELLRSAFWYADVVGKSIS